MSDVPGDGGDLPDFDEIFEDAANEVGADTSPDIPFPDYQKEPAIAPPDPDNPSAVFIVGDVRAVGNGGSARRELFVIKELPEQRDDAEYVVWFGTNRRVILDSVGEFSDFSGELEKNVTYYGKCRVFIPKSHKIGSTGSVWWKRLFSADDRLRTLGTDHLAETDFWNSLRAAFNLFDTNERTANIFIHGFNVPFQSAILQAAQFGFDLSIRTPMALFSWASHGTFKNYTLDEDTIAASEDAIEDFIIGFANNLGASRVNIIAHSMGNRGVIRALTSIINKSRLKDRKLYQLVLAAADVSIPVFERHVTSCVGFSERTTLYVSRKDLAVRLSKWFHGTDRVGFNPPLRVYNGIDTINAANVDLTRIGHGYVSNTRPVLNDLFQLLSFGLPPERRNLRRRTLPSGLVYWELPK